MTPHEELEEAAAQLLDASHTEQRTRFSGAPVWTRFAEEEYFALLANAVRRVRAEQEKSRYYAVDDAGTLFSEYPRWVERELQEGRKVILHPDGMVLTTPGEISMTLGFRVLRRGEKA